MTSPWRRDYNTDISPFSETMRKNVIFDKQLNFYSFKFKLDDNDPLNKQKLLPYRIDQVSNYRGGIDIPLRKDDKVKLYKDIEDDKYNDTEYLIYSPVMTYYATDGNKQSVGGAQIETLHYWSGDAGSSGDGWNRQKGKRYHRLIEAFLEIIFEIYGGVKHTNHTGQKFGLEFSEDNTLVDHYHANNNGILPSRLFEVSKPV